MTRTAVITGGSAGIGRATLDALIARGDRVAVLARGQGRLDEIAALYRDRVLAIACDVSDDAAVQAAADRIVAKWGAPDIWVNCAMLTSFSPFAEMDAAEFEKITATTYLGQVNGCRAALRVMERGNIVNVGSGLAYRSVPNQAAYCGAKHAINGFSQAIRSEILREGRPIELSLVQLPAVNTPQFDWARNRMDRKPQPAPPIFQPEVAAGAILRAIDTGAREILVGRSVLKLVFGNMLVPDYIDHKLADMGVEVQKSDQVDWGRGDNLDTPLDDYPSKAHGSYDTRASSSAVVVDADMARKAVAIGGAALVFALGALVGRAGKGALRSGGSDRALPDRADQDWGYDRPPLGPRPSGSLR